MQTYTNISHYPFNEKTRLCVKNVAAVLLCRQRGDEVIFSWASVCLYVSLFVCYKMTNKILDVIHFSCAGTLSKGKP